ncbi:MAG: ABC transporter ATP-binding protein [Candidatus Wildermuthbacteria bacterium]|nr:ABC transporter ATP-binding protein [Candidatus Wildermuthbacteria bacterium]
MTEQPVIQLKNISLVHNLGKANEMAALTNINLEIYSGEYLIIFGPSGCGKSTLLYSMSGMETPTAGTVTVARQDFINMTPNQFVSIRRSWMGTIFQAYNLIPSLNVLDNVMLPQTFAGALHDIKRRKALELLENMKIGHLAKRFPTQLSGGQQQRVAIARALIFNPPILLADEPVGNLDSESAATVMKLLADLNEQGKKTIVLVTHEPYHLHYAHRVVYMKDGKIVRQAANPQRKPIAPITGRGGETSSGAFLPSLPHLSAEQLQIKALVQHLLHQFTLEEVERIEEGVGKRVEGQLDAAALLVYLDKPFEEGGAGLYKQRAREFSEKIERILSRSKLLKNVSSNTAEESDVDKKAREIRRHLLEDYSGVMGSSDQVQRLDRFVRLRLEGKINKEHFEKYLDAPLKSGGAGLDKRTVRKFSKTMEFLLAKYS